MRGSKGVSAHQLSNGLFVSGQPDRGRDKGSIMGVPQMPYTGGDIKKSGELGKMLNIPVESTASAKAGGRRSGGPLTGSSSQRSSNTGAASSTHSGPLPGNGTARNAFSSSGPLNSSGTPAPWVPGKSAGTFSGPFMGAATQAQQQHGHGSTGGSQSGPLGRSADLSGKVGVTVAKPVSGPLQVSNSLKTSGPQQQAPVLPATGLITSGPIITSGPLTSTGAPRKGPLSGPQDASASILAAGGGSVKVGESGRPSGNSLAINSLSNAHEYSFPKNFPRMIIYTLIPLFVIGFIAGAFIFAAVKNAILLFVVAALFGVVVILLAWNTFWGKQAIYGFMAKFPHSDLSTAKDGQLVKITGVVTCGSVPLESSYQKISRCVYTSTGLFEYRHYSSKKASEKHRRFTWGLRHGERYVVDFYISDFQTGLRALVKAGYGARVISYVDESPILDLLPSIKEFPTDFLRWLTERNLSADGRVMRLKEGYVKEGSTVTVMGVVQRHENILMLVSPPDPMSTGCQWSKFILPATLEGIILRSEEPSKADGIPV
ncbi:uncharacterized membrane protein At1g16860 [Physcomitrium patens]|uniref:Ubiquitin-specific protease family C19-related protein n=1 Tax=Physcomitrium patens TaxID=3218 RepID=A0A2K1JPJ3_PHYPA|nr:uncharacterized membrane protein At1g16860-like [Physcomitrium patens]PNR43464.1 hypothetical protein PHYPA_015845 [Physcomitrium patens]|eukprot:XP_024389940.1 uncharacterized membrane protein At1g16860-like [Physcomitrella patens]